MRKQFLVAVYGTLKTGKGNHSLMALIKAKLVGTGKTVEKYPIIVGDGLPYLFENAGVGHQVEVEIYSVDKQALKILDTFEGHPNFYVRKNIKCELSNGETRVCFIYFIKKKERIFRNLFSLKIIKKRCLYNLASLIIRAYMSALKQPKDNDEK